MIDLDRKGEGSEEPRVYAFTGQETICDHPALWALLQELQMLLDGLDLGGVSLVCGIVELGYELGEG